MRKMKALFKKTLVLHAFTAKRFGYDVQLVRSNSIVTQRMEIDKIDKTSIIDQYSEREDYARYRTLELIANELLERYGEKISDFCIAEAGVNSGLFAEMISAKFQNCKIYLYDTFKGFDSRDMKLEKENKFTSSEYLDEIDSRFKAAGEDSLIEQVFNRVKNPKMAVIRQGYFPDTVEDEKNEQFCFVSLDMDIYKPMYEGILFFYPRLISGGVIFVHDYNNLEYKGVKKALVDAEKILGKIPCIPISDKCGTLILVKI